MEHNVTAVLCSVQQSLRCFSSMRCRFRYFCRLHPNTLNLKNVVRQISNAFAKNGLSHVRKCQITYLTFDFNCLFPTGLNESSNNVVTVSFSPVSANPLCQPSVLFKQI